MKSNKSGLTIFAATMYGFRSFLFMDPPQCLACVKHPRQMKQVLVRQIVGRCRLTNYQISAAVLPHVMIVFFHVVVALQKTSRSVKNQYSVDDSCPFGGSSQHSQWITTILELNRHILPGRMEQPAARVPKNSELSPDLRGHRREVTIIPRPSIFKY